MPTLAVALHNEFFIIAAWLFAIRVPLPSMIHNAVDQEYVSDEQRHGEEDAEGEADRCGS